ncbi:MAG: Asp-tRNA(Asn)/Glu-tRNA(Gln) amidotransferase subunit GatC [Saprospiraceae bacterium]|jgi:aspartyl-tRNA(Asn)/glutamyl-tRNA(Gln) amidotransferase subunit C|nr:Asp-tRNA(Asn)/Glu-tRNA(Gln) amidotransferase subunit GatC [Saprospiraceae bacterium]MDG2418404.1 Asp-tRNA(Asn)/Glu-tRNA(Gln) amidotransferase subunit GatC [Saprospiraceae bacterium]
MKINQSLISKLEHLARLELSNSEKEEIQKDLNNILQMVEKMNELNTDDVEPLVYINEQQNVWREDKIANQVDRKDALRNAPDKNEQFFKVPKVIK